LQNCILYPIFPLQTHPRLKQSRKRISGLVLWKVLDACKAARPQWQRYSNPRFIRKHLFDSRLYVENDEKAGKVKIVLIAIELDGTPFP